MDNSKNLREDIGYVKVDNIVRPKTEWANQVMIRLNKKSPVESPLKEWWKKNQSESKDQSKHG